MKRSLNFYEALFCVFLLLKLGFKYPMSWLECFLPFILMYVDSFAAIVFAVTGLDNLFKLWILQKRVVLVTYFAGRRSKRRVNKAIKTARNAGK